MSTFALALPDDPDLLGRLTTALQVQANPPIALARSGEAVITFDSITPPMMLKSRVVQALEVAHIEDDGTPTPSDPPVPPAPGRADTAFAADALGFGMRAE